MFLQIILFLLGIYAYLRNYCMAKIIVNTVIVNNLLLTHHWELLLTQLLSAQLLLIVIVKTVTVDSYCWHIYC